MAKYEQHICTCTQSRRVTKQIVYKFYTLVIKNITVFVNATVETRCNLRQVTVAWKNVTMYFLIFCFVLSKRSHKQLPNNCKHRFFLQLALACAPMRVLKVSDKYNLLINRLFGECDFHIWEIISFTNKFLFSILAMISVNEKLLVLFYLFHLLRCSTWCFINRQSEILLSRSVTEASHLRVRTRKLKTKWLAGKHLWL